MKINISQRDKSLLLVLLGMLLFFVSYYFGYRTFQYEAKQVKAQNEILDAQISALEEIAENKDMYAAETERLQADMEEKIASFPTDMAAEEIVLYIKALEQETQSYVASATLPGRVNIPIEQELEINKLEMTEDVTGVVAENCFVNDGSIPETENMAFSCIESDISFATTYAGLKEMVEAVTTDSNRKSVDNVSLVFNENTGNLSGNMTVNYFILSGTGKEYMQPKASESLKGIDCIFGTLSN